MTAHPPAPFFTGCALPDAQSFDAWPDQSLLQSLESGGIAWPSSCRSGHCRTCIGKLDRGLVHYVVDGSGLSAEEMAEGWVLPCVAQPCSDLTLSRPD